MTVSTKIASALTKYGRSMSLKRRVGTTATFSEVQVMGTTRGYEPHEVLGSVAVGDREVTISNAEISAAGWPGPPKRGDLLVIDGTTTTIQSVDSKYLGTEVLSHVIQVRG